MQQVGFPDFEAHRREHQAFVARFTRISREFRLGKDQLDEGDSAYLATWVQEHIAEADAAIGRLVREKGLGT